MHINQTDRDVQNLTRYNEHKASLTLSKHQYTKQQVSLYPICMLLSVSGSIPAFASVYFCLAGLWAASMCICVYLCQSTPH